MMVQPPQTHNHGKYDNYRKGCYFLLDDDDDKTNYRYILSITWTEMGQFNTYNPTFYDENKKGNRKK